MYKSRDLIEMVVVNKNNKSKGKVKEIFFDINEKKIIGFEIGSMCIWRKNNFVKPSDIISITNKIQVSKFTSFKEKEDNLVLNHEVYNGDGILLGNISEVLIEEKKFQIVAFVVTPGIIEKFVSGKKILLASHVCKKGDYIIYNNKSSVKFISMVHEERRL